MRTVLIIAQVAILTLLAVIGAHSDSKAQSAYPVKTEAHQSL